MTVTERWHRVRELFEGALEQDPAGLHDWLEREAGHDREVLDEVRSLLQHHTRAGTFLSAPVVGRVAHLLEDGGRFEPGASVGPYTVLREIGRGGMGRVYLARDEKLGRVVALKALPPSTTRDERQRARLRREARAAALLTHPGICTIYALEEVDDDVFIAAEFVDGESLRDEMARGVRPSAETVLAAAASLSDALASAHQKGVTHRDLKPENVMRARDGRLKILDFGLALVDPAATNAEIGTRVTQPDTMIGTPAYMAPEQLNGQPADPRSDIFALGVLLYEYAAGVHPFEAPTLLALTARVLESEPPPLARLRPDLPAALIGVIERALRKPPSARWQSAAEIGPALARPAAGRIRTGAVSGWWRNHQAIALLLYFVTAAVAWQLKEWMHGSADTVFILLGVAATIVGVFRGHLLFTARVNPEALDAERRRAEPVTRVIDALIALLLAVDGWAVAGARPLAGVLTMALGVGIALARFVVEPATTRGAFGD